MHRHNLHFLACGCLCALCVLVLSACGSAPVPPKVTAPAPTETSTQVRRENFQVALDGGFALEFQLDWKTSALNRKSCYFLVSGTLSNPSARTLSKNSVLDFVGLRDGKQFFRDIANPVADIPPGQSAMFKLFSSPIYKEGCPSYDRFNVSLRKVFAD